MEVDVAVLGGGPGGYTAAIRAAQLGAKVACIEKESELGGTCLRVGCIPTKAWVQTAYALKEAEETFARFGVQVGEAKLDFPVANQWKQQVVDQMTRGVAGLFKANGVEWVRGFGRFKDANTIEVDDASAELAKQFGKRGISLQLEKQCTGIEERDGALTVHYGDGETVEGDLMLVSVGRGPQVEGIGLEDAGVQYDRRAGIGTD